LSSFKENSSAASQGKAGFVDVTICTGTACYIMGGSEILLLEEALPASIKPRVRVSGSPCLGHCRGKDGSKHTPCVLVNGQILICTSLSEVVRRVQEEVNALEQ